MCCVCQYHETKALPVFLFNLRSNLNKKNLYKTRPKLSLSKTKLQLCDHKSKYSLFYFESVAAFLNPHRYPLYCQINVTVLLLLFVFSNNTPTVTMYDIIGRGQYLHQYIQENVSSLCFFLLTPCNSLISPVVQQHNSLSVHHKKQMQIQIVNHIKIYRNRGQKSENIYLNQQKKEELVSHVLDRQLKPETMS